MAEVLIETLYHFYAYIWIPLFWIMNCYEIIAVLCFVVHIPTTLYLLIITFIQYYINPAL